MGRKENLPLSPPLAPLVSAQPMQSYIRRPLHGSFKTILFKAGSHFNASMHGVLSTYILLKLLYTLGIHLHTFFVNAVTFSRPSSGPIVCRSSGCAPLDLNKIDIERLQRRQRGCTNVYLKSTIVPTKYQYWEHHASIDKVRCRRVV